MEAWSVGKYAKRSCLVHLGSEDQRSQAKVHEVLDLTQKAAATHLITNGPITVLEVLHPAPGSDDVTLLVEASNSSQTPPVTHWSATNTGPNMDHLADSIITLSGGTLGIASLDLDVGAGTVQPYDENNIGNRYKITIPGVPGLIDQLWDADDPYYVPEDSIPVTRMFQGDEPNTLHQDTGHIFVNLAFRSFSKT